ARLALEAGAEQVLIFADAPAPDLGQIVDRITSEQGPRVQLVQDMPSLSRALCASDQVIVLAENLVVPPEAIDALLDAAPTAMLALPDVPATARFERIDAQTMWGGAIALPAANILATLDMLGDWDLVLTLLRRAVQAGIPRVLLSPETVMDGRLTLASDQASADIALESLSDRRHAAAAEENGGLGNLLAPVSRSLVRELVRRQVDPATIGIGSLVLSAVGLALASSLWTGTALLVMLLALAASDLSRQTALVTLRAEQSPWRQRVVDGAALLVLVLLGVHLAEGRVLAMAGAWLPLVLIALLAGADELRPPQEPLARSLRLTPSIALILLLLGSLFGIGPAAFVLLGLLACAAIGLRLLRAPQAPSGVGEKAPRV
ncbi:MAG: hypothetical protein J0G94_07850, partial [Sphingomonadales bacterium]|nr:hypothetical protein [Sphingomonadales bacterium]